MNEELYFKDAFTEVGGSINLEVNNLRADCITSNNNKFSLDNEGNLVVNSITTNVSPQYPSSCKSAIMLTLNDITKIRSNTAWQINQIPFNAIYKNVGTEFELLDNGSVRYNGEDGAVRIVIHITLNGDTDTNVGKVYPTCNYLDFKYQEYATINREYARIEVIGNIMHNDLIIPSVRASGVGFISLLASAIMPYTYMIIEKI